MQNEWRRWGLLAAVAAVAVASAGPSEQAQSARAQKSPLGAGLPAVSLSGPCRPSGKTYLRAHIRGDVRMEVDLRGRALACEGGPRFDGSGIRMGFEGKAGPKGRRVRMLFGIDRAREGRAARELPTNLTVIFEGEKLLFATQGADNCTVDRLTQKRIGAAEHATSARAAAAAAPGARAKTRSYLVTAHGFCIAPANDIRGDRRILVATFDFAGRADFNRP